MEHWIGEVIAKMHTHKITQTALAAHLGMRRDYISRLLNGHAVPEKTRERIIAAVDELVERAA